MTKFKDAIIIQKMTFRKRNFTIAYDGEYYMAIEDKYITNGCMNTTLNGLQMNANKKLKNCIQSTKNSVNMDYYTKIKGMSKEDAMAKIFHWDEETTNRFKALNTFLHG